MSMNLLDFDLDALAAYCEQLGEKRYRATQLFLRWHEYLRTLTCSTRCLAAR